MAAPAGIAQRMVLSGENLSAGSVQWGNRAGSAPTGRAHRPRPPSDGPDPRRQLPLLKPARHARMGQLGRAGRTEATEATTRRRLPGSLSPYSRTRQRRVELQTELPWLVGAHRAGARTRRSGLHAHGYYQHQLHRTRPAARSARPPHSPGGRGWSGGGSSTGCRSHGRGRAAGESTSTATEEFERSEAAELPPGTRLHPEGSRKGYLEPDATLIGRSGEDTWAVLIEYDRTERPHKQIDRLRRYDRWLLDGWRGAHFAAHSIPPSVIFLTARERPLRRLIETADRTFAAWHGHEHAGPRQGTHPARQRVVFTSRERVLAGDWTMQRTPSLPPELREDFRACSPRSIDYNLPALFAGSDATSGRNCGS